MTSNAIFLAGLALFDGVAVVWAVWEFWSGRRRRNPRRRKPAPPLCNQRKFRGIRNGSMARTIGDLSRLRDKLSWIMSADCPS